MMMNEQFEALHLQVVELPLEFEQDKLIYKGFIRELPFISAEAGSKKELYRQLLAAYQSFAESQLEEQEEEKMTSELLSVDQLLKYYDGEVFDGFDIDWDQEK